MLDPQLERAVSSITMPPQELTSPANLPTLGSSNRRNIAFHKARKGTNSLNTHSSRMSPELLSERKDLDTSGIPALPGSENGLYPESEVLALMRWKKTSAIGPGLLNLGNTCFLNATLQCLAYLPPLAQYFLHDKSSPKTQTTMLRLQGPQRDWLGLVGDLIVNIQQGGHALDRRRSAVAPKAIVSYLKSLNHRFYLGRQEDAHELLRHLIDALQRTCLKAARVEANAPNRLADTTFMHRIFGGYLRSQVRCTTCGYCSNTYDSFLDLSLEIHGKVTSLTDALSRFQAKETLDKANRWRCTGCKHAVCAEKQLTIHTAPNVLTIHFKRFMFGSRSRKVDKYIRFPDTLTLRVSGKAQAVDYQLVGVLVHAGVSVHTGHYFSYVRAANDLWYLMDDNSVRQVTQETVLHQHAYILFYLQVVASKAPPSQLCKAMPNRKAAAEAGPSALQLSTSPVANVSPRFRERLNSGWTAIFARAKDAAAAQGKTVDIGAEEDMGKGSTHPQGLAAFMQARRGRLGKEGKAAKEGDEMSLVSGESGGTMALSEASTTSGTESSWEGSQEGPQSSGNWKKKLGYSYAGNFLKTRFSKKRWRKLYFWKSNGRGDSSGHDVTDPKGTAEGLPAGAEGQAEAESRVDELLGACGEAEQHMGSQIRELRMPSIAEVRDGPEEEQGGEEEGKTDAEEGDAESTGAESDGDNDSFVSAVPFPESPAAGHVKTASSVLENQNETPSDSPSTIGHEGFVEEQKDLGSAAGQREGHAGAMGMTQKGKRRPFDPSLLTRAGDLAFGVEVGQWEDAGGEVLVQEERVELLRILEGHEERESAKRKLSTFAAAAVAGRQKKVKRKSEAGDGAETARCFQAKQEALVGSRSAGLKSGGVKSGQEI